MVYCEVAGDLGYNPQAWFSGQHDIGVKAARALIGIANADFAAHDGPEFRQCRGLKPARLAPLHISGIALTGANDSAVAALGSGLEPFPDIGNQSRTCST